MEQTNFESTESIDMEYVADSTMEQVEIGAIITGEVVSVDNDYVYINLGAKSDGRISLSEFDEKPTIGQNVEVILDSTKFVDGMYQCSKKSAEAKKNWDNFIASNGVENTKITGSIIKATPKGKIINCHGVHAFLPFSLSGDLKSAEPSDTEYSFLIKTIDNKKRSIIISRKDILSQEFEEKWNAFIENYKAGDRVKGLVSSFVEYGAFIRVEGLDALLHRSDISWKKQFKQRKLLKLETEYEFVILDIKMEERKISLGLKQLTEDPWLNISGKYSIGAKVHGVINTITDYGAFVELEDGVEGFIKNSEISWTKSNTKIKDLYKKNDEADFQILDINEEDKKISLSIKQLLQNPWDTIDERFPVGAVVKSKVKKIVKFGLFVELEDDIDGLVHISDITWDGPIEDLNSKYKEGDEVEFKILDIKKADMKISCGIKQLIKSPWQLIKEKYPSGMKVSGTISNITQFGLFIKLDDNLEGLVHISEVSRKRIENLEEKFAVGDKTDAIVLGVDPDKKRLSLSIKHFEVMSEKEHLDKFMQDKSPRTATLGDFVNLKLGE